MRAERARIPRRLLFEELKAKLAAGNGVKKEKKNQKPQKAEVPRDLEKQRDELFQKGSHFAPVSRDDIVGIDSILDNLEDVIFWLKHPQQLLAHRARPQPGLLLEGQPGTGKTLCSKYIAAEASAQFVSVRDYTFNEETPTAEDIADIFRRSRAYYAATNRPVILFWDEFEAFAPVRYKVHMKEASVVSQLTSEMDGIQGKCEGILLIGCTNYMDAIDPALLRDGRMGRHVHFTAPSRAGKIMLLQHYLSRTAQDAVAPGLDWEAASYFFKENAVASSIEESVNRVWLKTVIESIKEGTEPIVTQELLNEVLLEELLGPPPPFTDPPDDILRNLAIHELGHALVAYKVGVPIQIITIRPGAGMHGRVFTRPLSPFYSDVEEVRKQVCIGFGSMASEHVCGLPTAWGGSADFSKATKFAAEIIEEIAGLNGSWTGPLNFKAIAQQDGDFYPRSNLLREHVDIQLGQLVKSCYSDSLSIMQTYGKDLILALANRLIKDQTWTTRQFEENFNECTAETTRSKLVPLSS